MPELPEVETIRSKLDSLIKNKVIKEVRVLEKKQFIGDYRKIIGKKIQRLQRKGKILTIVLSNDLYLSIHLKLTGQLLFSSKIDKGVFKHIIPFTRTNKMPSNTTRIIFKFKDKSDLFFNDLRKFGWIKLLNRPQNPIGTDILSKDFNLDFFRDLIFSSKKNIKFLLLDQEKIAGIGNIYANDSLFLAEINPLRKANSLDEKEIKKLYQSIKKVINEGIKDQGSSGADEAFILPDGKKGKHQRYFLVYQRENKPCVVCKTLIKRIKQGGRSSFFCPKCQPEERRFV